MYNLAAEEHKWVALYRVLSHSHYWCAPGFDWRQRSVRLDVNAVFRPNVLFPNGPEIF